MIQLDPHCSALIRAEIIGGTLYIDTNFIFRLLGLHSPEMFFASRALVDLSHKLNYTLVYTPATRDEYIHALGNNLRSLQIAPKLPEDLLEAVVDISDDEDPIIAYYRKMMDTKSTSVKSYVSPDVYYEYFSEVESLLEPYGISINDQHCASIREEETELSLEASRLKGYVDDKRLRYQGKFYNELSPYVAEHDAFHRLLILHLRAGYDAAEFSDVPYWFLTCDSKLPGYDRVRRASEGLKTPFCVLSAQWLQTLRPFEPRLGSAAIVDSITSPLLRVFSPIPNSIIREVAGRVQLHKGYTSAVGKIAMKRQFLLQFAQTRDEEEKQELIENVFLEHAIEMENLKDEAEAKSEQSEEAIEQLQNKVSTLENEIKEVIQEKTNKYEDVLAQHQKELESRYKELQKEQTARIQVEEERDSYTSELETTKSQLKQTRNKQTDTNAQLDKLNTEFTEFRKQQKQSQRNWLAAVIILLYIIVLVWVQPWISGENGWFALSGLLTVLYICALIVFRPMSRGRLEKTFAIGFPVLILLSIALPLGREKIFFSVLGIIANTCGILALILFVIKADRNSDPP